MASVIVPDNLVIGPGITLHVTSFIVGPLGSDWMWHLYIRPHGVETANPIVMLAPVNPSDQHHQSLQIGPQSTAVPGTSYSTNEGFQTGATVDAVVELTNAAGTVVEESGATNSLTWDTNVSSRALIESSTSGGLTTEQAQQLADVHNLVAPPFTTTGGVALPIDIGDLIKRPALKLLGIDTTVHTLTGQGTLAIPSLLGFPTAFGLVMNVTSAPSGWGRKPGYVDSFNFRIAQFLLLMEAANGAGSMVVSEKRLHLEHETWIFPDTWADHVAYYIDPPCEVQVQFLTAFTP